MLKWLAVFLGGGLGSALRYALSGAVQSRFQGRFPWGTLAVNVLGCFGFGFMWGLLEGRFRFPLELRVMIFAGFFGGLTTFSALTFETHQLLADAHWHLAFGNIAAHLLLGWVGLWLGLAVHRII
jgi:CrcB protein